MRSLHRRDGIVWIQPYGVLFPMQAGKLTNITCIHTLAGFEKLVGCKTFTQEDLHAIFHASREDFEALACALYEALDGEPLMISMTPRSLSNRSRTRTGSESA